MGEIPRHLDAYSLELQRWSAYSSTHALWAWHLTHAPGLIPHWGLLPWGDVQLARSFLAAQRKRQREWWCPRPTAIQPKPNVLLVGRRALDRPAILDEQCPLRGFWENCTCDAPPPSGAPTSVRCAEALRS